MEIENNIENRARDLCIPDPSSNEAAKVSEASSEISKSLIVEFFLDFVRKIEFVSVSGSSS